MKKFSAKLFIDGGSRGNPGPSAYGYILRDENDTDIEIRGETIGRATNNEAEYHALIAGLEAAKRHGINDLLVISDSELVMKQMSGEYHVNNPKLHNLWRNAQNLVLDIGFVTYKAIRREDNKLADQLVNEALDR